MEEVQNRTGGALFSVDSSRALRAGPAVPRVQIRYFHRVPGQNNRTRLRSHGVDVGPGLWQMAVNGAATFAIGLCIGMAALAISPMLIGYQPVSLASGSMEPSLRAGDIVLTNPDAAVGVGSIIDYSTDSGNRIHRVIEVVGSRYRTKGDNNSTPDQELVAAEQIRGTGVFVVPFIGLPRLWFEQGQWLNLLLVLLSLMACAALARTGWLSGMEMKE